MEPIVLLHGYSSESRGTDAGAIRGIYGKLPDQLRERFGAANVLELDVSRYVSLDDALTIDDISRAMQRVLEGQFPHLLNGGFNLIAHSTGALVARNWMRRYWQAGPCPARRLVYLAGAHLGSGWAHIGRSQIAKFAREVFQGADRGVKVLNALEFGSNWTIEMHRELDAKIAGAQGNDAPLEFCLVGTQTPDEFWPIPVRYANENGSDSVVRASAANLNYSYVRLEPSEAARNLPPSEIAALAKKGFGVPLSRLNKPDEEPQHYEITEAIRPGQGRRTVPFAVIATCSHSFKRHSIVDGEFTRDQVMPLLETALNATAATYEDCVRIFDETTRETYAEARTLRDPRYLLFLSKSRQNQYDEFAQLIFRVFDQDGLPFKHFNVYLNSYLDGKPSQIINSLFEDSHANALSPHTIAFYLRLRKWEEDAQDWVDKLAPVKGVQLQLDAREPDSTQVNFLPLRFALPLEDLVQWLAPHRTTLIDIRMLRVSGEDVFRMVRG